MAVIEGARKRPFLKNGTPANGDFNGEADKGDLLQNTATGVLYSNTGTKTATVWTVVGGQVAP